MTKPDAESLHHFATVLDPIPMDERALIIAGLMEQIDNGTVKAVPISTDQITVTYTALDGTDATATFPDLVIQDSPKLQAWLAAQRKETRYAMMETTRQVVTTLERLKSKQDDFDRLSTMYRTQVGRDLGTQTTPTAAHPTSATERKQGSKRAGQKPTSKTKSARTEPPNRRTNTAQTSSQTTSEPARSAPQHPAQITSHPTDKTPSDATASAASGTSPESAGEDSARSQLADLGDALTGDTFLNFKDKPGDDITPPQTRNTAPV